MKATVVLMVGLPRSGKTTYTKKLSHTIPIICPDDVRRVLGCYPFAADREKEVWAVVKTAVEVLVLSGSPVVVLDATNVSKKRRKEWIQPDKWNTAAIWVDTHSEVCKQRATLNGQTYLIDVINRMADTLEAPTTAEGLRWVERYQG